MVSRVLHRFLSRLPRTSSSFAKSKTALFRLGIGYVAILRWRVFFVGMIPLNPNSISSPFCIMHLFQRRIQMVVGTEHEQEPMSGGLGFVVCSVKLLIFVCFECFKTNSSHKLAIISQET